MMSKKKSSKQNTTPNMLKITYTFLLLLGVTIANAQISPAISSWLQNTTETGNYYATGNSTKIPNNILVNCQKVEYSTDFVYVTATGVPAYPTGPFQDGNPSNATNQNGIYKIPLAPAENIGTKTATSGGNIGLFINGVALFDFRDGVGWNSTTNSPCGGPGFNPCPGGPMAANSWNRDAVPSERDGFDCSKGHPAMGNYHHHQNPSAFKLDKNVVSTICNLYDADGLYVIDSTKHSPLIGYAYDGFPIYGAYGYKNTDGTGGITRIKSGYSLRNITKRTTWADGTDVADGPDVNSTYFLGYFREDYEFIANANGEYLDVHNGRFCKTPEYPNGTYAYFATVDEDWNSAYPYIVGPTFYGVTANRKVTAVSETTTVYQSTAGLDEKTFKKLTINVFPNPTSDLIAIQVGELVTDDLKIELIDITGKTISETKMAKGSSVAYFDVQTVYEGTYLVKISNNQNSSTTKIVVSR